MIRMYMRTVDDYIGAGMTGMRDAKNEDRPDNAPPDHPGEAGPSDYEKRERRRIILQAQIEELKRLHQEQQESQRAILQQLEEIKRLEQEEQR